MSRALRIALWHDPPMGGARRSLAALVTGLAERGHQVDLQTLRFRPASHRRFAFYWNDYLTYQDLRQRERLEADLAVRLEHYDAVLASVLRDGTAPSLLKYCGVPTLYYCHEPPRRFYEPWCRPGAAPLTLFERGRLLWRRPAQLLLDRELRERDRTSVRSASRVLVNSSYTKSRVKDVYDMDAEVCYLGVDPDWFHPRPVETGDAAGVITVGSLEAHKGFDFLIQALGCLPEPARPSLTIIGSGGHRNMRDHLRRLAARYGVNIAIRQALTDCELVEAYQSSSVFVFGAHQEPFGLVLLEAMACGLPVVAVAEGGVPEIVEDDVAGYLTPREPEAFSARLGCLLTSPERRRIFGTNARAIVKRRWRWQSSVDQLERELLGVAGKQSRLAAAAP